MIRLLASMTFLPILGMLLFVSPASPQVQNVTGVEKAAENLRQQTIGEFNKWRGSIPDYEKRLYDRVKKVNKRTIRLTNLVIGGFVATILILLVGFTLIISRRKYGGHVVVSGKKSKGMLLLPAIISKCILLFSGKKFKYILLLLFFILGLFILYKPEIQSAWSSSSGVRSDKARTLNALRGAFGYGGLVHNFKDLILTGNLEKSKKVTLNLVGNRGVKEAISRYRKFELNVDETNAIDDIEAVFYACADLLKVVENLIKQERTAAEIDQVVRIDDGPALNGIAQLEKALPATGKDGRKKINKIEIVSRLHAAIGYGGMIHNYMDFILRKQPASISAVEENILQADAAIKLYWQINPLHKIERVALKRLQEVLDAYRRKIAKVKSLPLVGEWPEKIYEAVKTDEQFAIDALESLEKSAAKKLNEARFYVIASVILVLIAITYNAISSWLNGRNTKKLKRV